MEVTLWVWVSYKRDVTRLFGQRAVFTYSLISGPIAEHFIREIRWDSDNEEPPMIDNCFKKRFGNPCFSSEGDRHGDQCYSIVVKKDKGSLGLTTSLWISRSGWWLKPCSQYNKIKSRLWSENVGSKPSWLMLSLQAWFISWSKWII